MLKIESSLKSNGFSLIAGIDEAGRGPLAGPVVASAVILKDHSFISEINDSKLLSPKKREIAFKEIISKSIFGIGIVDSATIDRINIHNASILAMERAVRNLPISPDYLIIDGKIRLSNISIPQDHFIKGDSKSLSIASASIIAKVTRDRIMSIYHSYYPVYGFNKHKGYGTRDHYEALSNVGPSMIHRNSFNLIKNNNMFKGIYSYEKPE